MKILTLITFLLIALNTFSQKGLKEILPNTGIKINNFIPKGWLLLATAYGDFNKDGIKDAALVIIDSVQEKIVLDTHRSLVILQGIKNGYKLSGYCDSAILCSNCGGIFGDPFEGIEFQKNKLFIYHYGGSAWKWILNLEFQFRNSKWYLIGKTTDYFWSIQNCNKLDDYAGTNYKDINFITGQFEEKQISENCKLIKHIYGKARVHPLTELKDFLISNQ